MKYINIEIKIRISQFFNTDVMKYMKLLSVVTPSYISHVRSIWKKFWEENFTHAKMENCGRWNVRNHRDIRNDEQYIALEIYLEFVNMDNMKSKYPEPKYYLGISGKGLITYLGLNAIRRSTNIKKEKFSITESIIKNLYNIIMKFKDVPYESYVKKISTHISNASYFYPLR